MEKQVKITSNLDLQDNKLKNAKINANENEIENLTTESLAEGVLRQAMSSTPQENTILSESAVKQAIDVSVAEFNSMITSGLAEERQLRSQMDQDIINSLREEKTTRENADTTLQGNIDAESNARQLADTNLNNRITGVADNVSRETIARQNTDNNLQQQIDGLSAAANGITDIVQSKTDLDNYDTSTLHSGDIIQVLTDSTHDNATAYYRWNGTSFAFVGTIAPSYTKEEAQATFVPLTRTVNGKALSTNITLNASDVGAMPNTTDISDLVSERQAAAINSGITSEDVVQIGTNENDISDLKNSMIAVENDILNINSVVNNAVNIVSTKQDVLTSENAGANIRITGTGENLKISARIDGYEVNWEDIIGDPRNNENLNTILETKQDNLIAGDGISIENNVITNTRVSAEWGNITGNLTDQTDLADALNSKQDVLTAGNGIIIENSTISVDPEALAKSEYYKYNYTLNAGSTELSTNRDLTGNIINVFVNGIYQTVNVNYTISTVNNITKIIFTNSYNENASVDLEVFILNNLGPSPEPVTPIINILSDNQSSYTFTTNTTYQFSLYSSVSTCEFILTEPINKNIDNGILIHTYIGNASINLNFGTTYFFNNETPTLSVGCWDIIYVWNNLLNAWVCQAVQASDIAKNETTNLIINVTTTDLDGDILTFPDGGIYVSYCYPYTNQYSNTVIEEEISTVDGINQLIFNNQMVYNNAYIHTYCSYDGGEEINTIIENFNIGGNTIVNVVFPQEPVRSLNISSDETISSKYNNYDTINIENSNTVFNNNELIFIKACAPYGNSIDIDKSNLVVENDEGNIIIKAPKLYTHYDGDITIRNNGNILIDINSVIPNQAFDVSGSNIVIDSNYMWLRDSLIEGNNILLNINTLTSYYSYDNGLNFISSNLIANINNISNTDDAILGFICDNSIYHINNVVNGDNCDLSFIGDNSVLEFSNNMNTSGTFVIMGNNLTITHTSTDLNNISGFGSGTINIITNNSLINFGVFGNNSKMGGTIIIEGNNTTISNTVFVVCNGHQVFGQLDSNIQFDGIELSNVNFMIPTTNLYEDNLIFNNVAVNGTALTTDNYGDLLNIINENNVVISDPNVHIIINGIEVTGI